MKKNYGTNHNEERNTQSGRHVRGTIKRYLVLTFSIVLAVLAISAGGNPQGGQVTAGSATISSPNSATVQINQSSQKAVIDWTSYNIARHEKTQYVQPSIKSITLNRIDPNQGASIIRGAITANGQIILINPAGMVFDASARIDVSGLLATTANISNSDFMAGKYHFVQSPLWNGAIINNGKITIRNEGMAALVAPGVENNGVIVAKMGKVILASGTEYTIDFYGDQMIQFGVNSEVSKPAVAPDGRTLHSAVSNSGSIIANGGQVLLTAKTAGTILDNSINMSGRIEANTVAQRGGSIILGGGNGTVRVSGKMVAMGKHRGQQGGTVKVLGDNIQIVDNASIDVSGKGGGGTILVGGNFHGSGPEQNATHTYVAPTVHLTADALSNGNGGNIAVWSNGDTLFYGSISAKGGPLGGNGGFVETSGHYLDVANASVNLLAHNGINGTWLLDPTNIYIASSQANATTAGMTGTDNSASTNNAGTFAGSGAIQDSFLLTTSLVTGLNASNIIVTTTNPSGTGAGNITVVNAINWNSTNSLTLTAANNITINAAIGDSSAGTLILNAAGAVTQSAAGILGSGGTSMAVTQQGAGTTTLSQTNTYTGLTSVTGGKLSASTLANQGTTSNIGTGTLLINGGTFSYTGNTTGNLNRNLSVGASGGTLQATTSGQTLTLTGTINIAGSGGGANPLTIDVNAGNVTLNPGTVTTALSNLTVTGSGTGALTLSKTGIYTGSTTVNSGTLKNGIANALPAATALAFNGSSATYDLNNLAQATIGSLSGTDTTSVLTNSGASNLTLSLTNSTNNYAQTYAGTITGALGFTLNMTGTGSPTETFSNAGSSYTGATIITAGTLSVKHLTNSGSASSIGVGTVTPAISIGATGVLQFAGTTTDSTTRAITLTGSGGTLDASGTGTITYASATNLTGNARTLNLTGTGTGTISEVIATTTGGLTKSGTGNWTVSGTNTFTGATTINNGTLTVPTLTTFSTSGPLGAPASGAITLGNGTTTGILAYTGSNASSDRTFTLAGTGGGTIQTNAGSTGTLSLSGNITNGTSPLTFTLNGSAVNETGIISSTSTAGTLTYSGAGNLTLNAVNTYTGATTINSGTLVAAVPGALGPVAGGNINITANAGFTANLDLTNDNSLINTNGIIKLDSSAAGSTAGISTNTGISLSNPISLVSTNNVFLANTNTTILTGAITGTGGLTKSGTGILSFAGTSNNNTYQGVTNITAGSLQQGVANNFSASSEINLSNVSGAQLNLNGFAGSIGSLTGGGATGGNVLLTSAALTIGNDNTSPAAYAGLISSTTTGGSIVKTGTGTLTLSNTANTYTGTTTINNGTLSVALLANAASNSSLGAPATAQATIGLGSATAATLDVTATSTTNRNITIGGTGGGTVKADAGTLTLAGTITTASSQPITFNANNGNIVENASGIIQGAGNVNISGTNSSSVTFQGNNTYTGNTLVNSSALSINSINSLGGTGSGGSAATVSSGAELIMAFSGTQADTNTITLNGTGISNSGALVFNKAGTTVISNPISLASTALINVTTAGTYTIGGGTGITGAASSNLTINGISGSNIITPAISLNGTLTGSTGGTFTLSGNTTLTGAANGISLTGVGVTNSGVATAPGGITINAGTGTLTNSSGTLSNGGGADTNAISLTADTMTLAGGTITGGAAAVNLTSSTLSQAITIGAGSTGLGFSNAALNTITTTGTLTIGDVAHTGTFSTDAAVTGVTNPSGPWVFQTSGSAITLNNAVTTPGNLTLSSVGGAVGTGAINGTGALTIGSGGASNLTVNAGAGINLSSASNLANAVTLTNSTSGNVTFDDNRNMTLVASNSVAGGTLSVKNNTGTLSTSGAITTTGAGSANITLQTPGLLTISNAVTAGGSGSVSLTGGGITNSSTVTGPGGITANAGTGTLNNSAGTLTNSSGSTAINLTADTMTLVGGTITGGSGAVNLTSSTLSRAITIGAGSTGLGFSNSALNTITTTGTLTIGDAAHTGTFSTDAAVSGVTNPSGPWIFQTSGSAITLNNAVTTPGNLTLSSVGGAVGTGAINGTGALTIGTGGANSLTVNAGAGINLSSTSNLANAINLTNSTSGNIIFDNNRNMTLVASNSVAGGTLSVINNTGTLSTSGAITTTGAGAANITLQTPGLLSVSNAMTAGGSGTVSLTGAGITNTATITGPGGITANAGAGTLNNAAGTLTNSSGSTAINLTADTMTLAGGTITGGSGAVNLTSSTANRAITIGAGSTGLGFSNSALNTITTTGTLTIGDAAHTGTFSTDAAVTGVTNPSGPWVFQTSTGAMTLNNAVTTPGNLTLSSSGNAINGTGALTIGTAGANSLTVNVATGINLSSTSNLATTVNLTNTTSGNISLTDSIAALTISGVTDNAATSSSVNITNNNASTGNITVTGAFNAGTNAINLTTNHGQISQNSSGIITGGLLTTSSSTGTSLNSATNAVTSFNGTNTTGSVNLLDNVSTLTITSLTAPNNTASITNSNNIALTTGIFKTGPSSATLTATNGQITQDANGSLDTGTLITTSATGTILTNTANVIGQFNGTNTTSGNISVTATNNPFTITGITDNAATSSSVNITNSTAGAAITITGAFNAGTNAINITGTGQITQNSSGVITGGLLTTSSSTGTLLNSATNAVTSFNATNSTSGNISLTDSTGTLSVTGITDNAATSSAVNITNSNASGNISITGALNAGTNAINLTASNHQITQNSSGVITGGLLTTSSSTGTLLNSASNAVTSFNATNSTSGDISLTNTAAPLTLTGISEAGGGNINITNTGSITQAASSTVNAAAGNITENAGATTITLNSGSLLLSTGTINLISDAMSFDTSGTPSQIGGTASGVGTAATVILQPSTNSQTIGIAGGAGTLQLTAAMLNDVRATNVRIGSTTGSGNITIGTWTPASTFAASGVLTLETSGTITQSGAINFSNDSAGLLIRNSSAVTLTNANNVFTNLAATLGSGGTYSVKNAAASPLTVSSLTDAIGTVNGITASGGITLVAPNSITVNSGISNSGGATSTSINLTSDTMSLTGGTITAGAGAVNLTSSTVSRAITIGAGSTGLGFSNAALNTITTTGTLTIGDAAHTGTFSTDAAVSGVTNPSGPWIFQTSTGAITLNNAVTTPGNLTLSSSGNAVNGTGALTIGTGGANSLTVNAGTGINLSSTSNLANAVTLTNSTSGNIVVDDNRNMTLTASNSAAGGTLSVINNTGTLSTSGAITTTGAGAANITLQAPGLLTISNAITAGGSGSVSLTGGGITNSATVTGPGGITANAGTGTLNNSAGTLTNSSGSTAINLTADTMTLAGGTITGGSGAVNLTSSTANRAITIGAGSTGLGFSNSALNTITTTGTLTIGDAAHTGTFSTDAAVSGVTNPSGPWIFQTSTGAITLNNAVTTPGNLTLSSSGNAINGTGALTIGTGGANSLTVNAGTGINLSSTSNLANAVTLTNSTSGNIVFDDNRNMTLTASNSAAGGTLSVINNTGTLSTSGAITTTGAGAANITLQAPGLLTISNAITAGGSGSVSLTGGGITNSATVTGAGGITANAGTGTLDNSAGTLTNSSGSTAISLIADSMNLAGGTITAGSGNVSLTSSTANRAITIGAGSTGLGFSNAALNTITTTGTLTIGDAAHTGTFSTDAAVSGVTNPSGPWIFQTSTGAITLNNAVTTPGNLTLSSSGNAINGTGALTIGTGGANSLTVNAGTGINLNSTSNLANAVTLTNSTSGNIVFDDNRNMTLAGSNSAAAGIFSVINNTGTLSTSGTITTGSGASNITLQTPGLLSISNAITAGGSGSVSLTGLGITNSAVVTGPGGITANAGTSTLNNSAGTFSNSSGSTAINLTADTMTLAGGTITGGSGAVNLTSSTANRAITIGAGSTGLGFSNSALNTITTTGTLTIGDAAHTGTFSTDAAVSGVTNPSGPWIFQTSTGAITLNNAVTTPGNLTLSSSGNAINGTGALTIGTGGANSLTVNAGTGINLSSTSNLANAVTLTNSTSGNIVFDDNRNMTLAASNSVAGGTLSVINNTGTLSTSGAITTTGAGSANITLQTPGLLTISNTITAGGSGSVSLTGGGITNSATVTGPGGITANAGTGTLNNSAGTLTNSSGSTAISLIADSMNLTGGTITGGSGNVSLTSSTANRAITIGAGSTGLGLANAALNTITTTGTLTIGSTAHTGTLSTDAIVSSITNPSGAWVFQTSGGTITLNNAVTTPSNLTLSTVGGGAGTGAINGTALLTIGTGGANSLTVNAGAGININNVGNLSNAVTLTNSTSGNIIFDGNLNMTLAGNNAASGGTFSVTNNTGTLSTSGAITSSSNITLQSPLAITINNPVTSTSGNINLTSTAGTISEAGSGTLSGALLTTSSAGGTTLGNANTVSSFNATNITSGNVSLTNTASTLTITGITNLLGNASITNAGNITHATNSIVDLGGTGLATENAGANTITLNSGALILGNANLTADLMSFDTSILPAQIGGTLLGVGTSATVILQPSTNSQTIGIAGGAGTLQLTAAMLNDVRATNVRIGSTTGSGNITIGTWTPASNFSASGVLTLETSGTITQTGAINFSNNSAGLLVRNSSAVTLTNANNVFTNLAATLGSGGTYSVKNAAASPLTVSSLTDDIGTVNGITASGGVTLVAPNSITVNSGISNSGGATSTSINLTSDTMSLTGGTITAGAGAVNLTSSTVSRAITIGAGSTGLGFSNAALNTITTTGTLTIGDAAHTGTLSTDAAVTGVTNPSGPWIFQTSTGAITLNNAVTTPGNLTLSSSGNAINGTGALTIGTGGANSLTVNAGTGINLSSTSNLANAVTLTNSTSGNIVFDDNRNMTLTASNSAAGGTLSVINNTGTLSTSGAITTTGAGSANITLQTPGLLSVSNAITAGGSGSVSLTGGGITNSATVTGPGGITANAGTGTLNNSAGTLTNSSGSTAINLTADTMTLAGGTITGGSGAVNLTSSTANRAITIGAGSTGLGFSNAALNTITTTGTLTIGDAAHTGTFSTDAAVSGVTNPSGPWIFQTSTGAITLNNAVTTPGNLTLSSSGNAVNGTGALTIGTGGANSLTVNAGTGINLSSTSNLANAVTLTNSTSGNIVFDDNRNMTLAGSNSAAGGTFSVINNTGTLSTNGTITTGSGASNITLQTPGLLSISNAITAGGSGSVSLTGAGITNSAVVTGPGGITANAGTSTLNNSAGTFSNSSGSTAINLTADTMTLAGGTITGGSGAVNLTSSTLSRAITIGAGSTGLGFSNAALNTITTTGTLTIGDAAHTGTFSTDAAVSGVTNPSGPWVFQTSTGAITLNNAVTTPGNLTLSSSGNAINGTGALTIGTGGANSLTVNAGTGINLSSTSNLANAVTLTNSTSGNIVFDDNRNMTLTASNSAAGGTLSVVNNTGTLSTSGAITTTGAGAANITLQTPGLLTISNAITAGGSGLVSLTGTGITNSATVTGPGGITANAGTGTLNNSAGTLTNSSGSTAINLTADTMTLAGGTITGGSGAVNLTSSTANRAITIGAGSTGLGFSNAALNTITTTGTLTIGDAAHTGTFSTDAAVSGVTNPSGPWIFQTSTGAITLNNAVTTPGNLTLSSSNAINGTGALTIGTGGANSLTVNAGTGINLSSTSNLANAVTLTNSTSGNIVFDDNRNMTLAASNSASGGSLSVINNTGTLSTSGAITGSGASNITLQTPGAMTINNAVTSDSGDITLISNAALTLNASISTNTTGNSIVLADGTFINNAGASALNPGTGSFLVWSGNPANDTRGGLTYNFKQYNATYNVTTVLGTGNGFLYTTAPIVTPILTGTVSKSYDATTAATLAAGNYTNSGAIDGDTITLNNPTSGTYATANAGTGINVSVSGISLVSASNGSATVYGYQLGSSSANANIGTITPALITITSNTGQTKVYGTDDPASAASAYGLTSGTLFGGNTLTGSMGRVVGESVGSYNFTQNTVSVSDGNSGNNYAITFNGSTNPFVITAKALTGSIANQSKVYGANDPALGGITENLAGIVNDCVTDINGNATSINDTGNVSTTLASLTRTAGETVGSSPYSITNATYNALTGSAASNYSIGSGLTGSPTLSITKANLTGAVANQSKIYGTSDPALPSVILGGQINTTVTDWMDNTTDINDTSAAKVATTLNTLTRAVGENVGSYNITAATFNALTGTSAGNYNTPSFVLGNTLTINKANLTGAVANQSKIYGTNDPALPSVILGGQINTTVTDWMDNTTDINDTSAAKVATTLNTLTRNVGENVGSYAITAATFNALTGTSAGNYNTPSFVLGNTLTINKANLTGAVANQSKIYGTNDPALPSVILGGQINTTVTDWMDNTTDINDTSAAKVATTLNTLTRAVGENVGSYNITAATFNALTGTSAGNYNTPSFVLGNTLTINKANLTGAVANQSKIYGTNDPALPSVILGGQINTTVTDWMDNTTDINDTSAAKVATTLNTLTRAVGENVGSYNITAATFNALTGTSAGNYNTPSFVLGNTLTINKANLTGAVANQSKIYGTNDPALPSVILGGQINTTVTDWMDNTTDINDTSAAKVATTLNTLTRAVGENVGSYNITAATFNALTGTSAGNYNTPSFVLGNTLTINKANLTGAVANQSKIYGTNDPALPSVILGGQINTTVTDWMDNTTDINDTSAAKVATTLNTLTRAVGENVGSYNITAATFNALTGTSAGNYNTPSFVLGNTLTINKANLTGAVANQSKIYGTNDPALPSVILGGQINTTVTDWMDNTTDINDTSAAKVATTLNTLTRAVGENVGSYNITAATFNALTGTSAGNYNTPSFVLGNTLTINKANLTGAVANQSKIYGTNDPALPSVILGGQINTTVTDWMDNTTDINDTSAAKVATTLNTLTRAVGENVGSYNITAATFNALTGTSAGNYNTPSFVLGNTLTINKANLTGAVANQSKIYGTNDPALPSVILGGQINTTVTDWMDNTTDINDTSAAKVATTLNTLTRNVGENVGSYAITAATFNALTGTSAGNYNTPSFVLGNTLTINKANLTGAVANQSKIYGTNDPALPSVILGGQINTTVTDWMDNTTDINDTSAAKVATTLNTLTRAVGENVGSYNITAATFNALTGTSAGNYNTPSFVLGNTLTINKANLTGAVANQSKIYGTNDPALPSVILGGQINTTVTDWMDNTTDINDTSAAKVATTLNTLTRNVGENVGSYAITAATFNALTGTSAGNYNTPSFVLGNTLTINKANLTGAVANQSKIYGTSDPALPSVILGGQINTTVTDWMDNTTDINDTSAAKVATTLNTLTRAVGENVGCY